MAEPTTTAAGTVLGVKYGTLVAGTVGSILSLRYLDDLTMTGRLFAIVAGVAAASYGTPALDSWLDLPTSIEYAVSFLLGLSGMNLVPGIVKISEKFAQEPFYFITRVLSLRNREEQEHDD